MTDSKLLADQLQLLVDAATHPESEARSIELAQILTADLVALKKERKR